MNFLQVSCTSWDVSCKRQPHPWCTALLCGEVMGNIGIGKKGWYTKVWKKRQSFTTTKSTSISLGHVTLTNPKWNSFPPHWTNLMWPPSPCCSFSRSIGWPCSWTSPDFFHRDHTGRNHWWFVLEYRFNLHMCFVIIVIPWKDISDSGSPRSHQLH